MKTCSPFFNTPRGIFCMTAMAMVYCLCAMAMRPAYGQNPPVQPMPTHQPDPQAAQPDEHEIKEVVLNGTIVKSGSVYVLRDASGTEYKLDDQSKAQPYEGKYVKVTGRLEASHNKLHVSKIEDSVA